MKRLIKVSVATAAALAATPSFATNGDHLIGLGGKSRAMGGAGIAKAFGADSALINPALISAVAGSHVMFGGTFFMPSVEFGSNAFLNASGGAQAGFGGPAPQGSAPVTMEKSDADKSVIPEVALASRINDHLVVGLGMYGVAGMGTDFRETIDAGTGISGNGSFGMRTNLELMRFAVPVAFEHSGLSVGVAPMLQYGALSMAYSMPVDTDGNGMPDKANAEGNGVSQDFGLGYEVGLAYDFGGVGVEGLVLGAKYQSAIDMEYKHTLSNMASAFGLSGIDDHLEQPAEFGVGAAYTISGNTITVDYKQIMWSAAAGYSDFGWEDQSVIAAGYEYAVKDSWAVRLGYNYAENPIKEFNGAGGMANLTPMGPANYEGAAKNFFNLAGFPGVVEQHMTAGGSYHLSKMVSLDLAFVYSPEVSLSYDVSAMAEGLAGQMVQGGGGDAMMAGAAMASTQASTAEVKHSQMALTFALNYMF